MAQENTLMTSNKLTLEIEQLVPLPVKINLKLLRKVPDEHVKSAWYSKQKFCRQVLPRYARMINRNSVPAQERAVGFLFLVAQEIRSHFDDVCGEVCSDVVDRLVNRSMPLCADDIVDFLMHDLDQIYILPSGDSKLARTFASVFFLEICADVLWWAEHCLEDPKMQEKDKNLLEMISKTFSDIANRSIKE